jgi:hypothetical protein
MFPLAAVVPAGAPMAAAAQPMPTNPPPLKAKSQAPD